VALRIKNCGSLATNYTIYDKPSGQCQPPTARPGTSMHEKGLAIDVSNCGSHTTECWKWLNNNAAKFGLRNLPSEPWHWSTAGR
jgi:LAS superfamily LD-carboxypeptidase LdcB